MNKPGTLSSNKQPSLARGILARGGQILFVLMILALILFIGSGNVQWTAAWVFLGISVLSIVVNSIFLLRSNPETVAERGTAKGWQAWDKLISGLYASFQYLLLPLVAALDQRFGWSGEIGRPWHVAGGVVYALCLALGGWAMITNAYFSTAVRIQTDRGHQVCTGGPYRYVRHPGYLGFGMQSPAIAILLGSLWALIPAMLAVSLMITRTVLEDRMLMAELPGYPEYAQEVRFRLVPGVW